MVHMLIRPHILAIAALAALVFGWLFSGQFHPGFMVLVALDWFVVNLLNRVVDLDEDARNGVPGTAFASRHRVALTVSTLAIFGGAVVGGHLWLPEVTPLRVAFHLIGFAYNYRILPAPKGRTRFKEMYALKNLSSGILFVLSVILLPLYGSHSATDVNLARAAWLTLFFLPLELTYEVLFDLRDVDGDRAEGVPTFPVVHGERWAYGLCAVLLLVSGLAPLLGHFLGPLRIREAVLVAGALQQGAVFWYVHRKGPTQQRVVNVTYLGAAQLASYCVWVAIGLPLFD